MGDVFEAYDQQRAATVALKTMSRLDATSVYELKNEFRALSGISHPNLVQLHELFGEGDLWFFSMEIVHGQPFDRWARPNVAGRVATLDESRLRKALSQLLVAVEKIHSEGKLHRDLKPSNVLVTEAQRVVVLDFGLAVGSDEGSAGNTTSDYVLCGTPAFVAPEQLRGERASTASDYYAVGVMLFQALTGTLPFTGEQGLLVDKQRHPAPSPASLIPDLPRDLVELTAVLLSMEPSKRPTASTLREWAGEEGPISRSRSSGLERRPLLGRDTELRRLRDAYALSKKGQPAVIRVTGASGIGKSALVHAFLAEVRSSAVILTGRCYERENVPYKGLDALMDDLSRYLCLLSSVDAAALLPRNIASLTQLFPVLNRVAGIATAPRRITLDPSAHQERAFAALAELLRRICDRRPVVAFIDDLQWTDTDSARALDRLLRQPDPPPMLLILVRRGGGMQHPAVRSLLESLDSIPAYHAETVDVGPLPQPDIEVLICREGCSDIAWARAHAPEAQGSPFFAGELALAALNQRNAGVGSLHEVVARRVRALPHSTQCILFMLALAGQPIALDVLDASEVVKPRDAIDRLCDERLTSISNVDFGARLVECYHDKIREIVCAGLSPSERQSTAAVLADALIRTSAEETELVAHCLLLAGQPVSAAEYAAAAAQLAHRTLAFARSARLSGFALTHGHFSASRRRKLQADRAEALGHAGNGAGALAAYLEAREGADAFERIELTRKAGAWAAFAGQETLARSLFAEALRPHSVTVPGHALTALAALAGARTKLLIRGLRFKSSDEHSKAIVEKLEALRHTSFTLMGSDQLRGSYLASQHTLEALESGHSAELAHALGMQLFVAASLRTPKAFIEATENLADQLCSQLDDETPRQTFHVGRGAYRLFRTGDFEGALMDWERALQVEAAPSWFALTHDRSMAFCYKAHTLFLLGRLREASVIVKEQFERAVLMGKVMLLPYWAWLSTVVLLGQGDEQLAKHHVDRALESLSSLSEERVESAEILLLQSQVSLALYRGDALREWIATEERRQRLRKSLFARVSFGPTVEILWGGLAAESARSAHSDNRREMLRAVEDCAKRVHGSLRIQPALACARGMRTQAVDSLRAMIARPQTGPLFANAARRRLGNLLTGEEGPRLVRNANAYFFAAGVVDPERYVRTLLPGVELDMP